MDQYTTLTFGDRSRIAFQCCESCGGTKTEGCCYECGKLMLAVTPPTRTEQTLAQLIELYKQERCGGRLGEAFEKLIAEPVR